MISLKTTKTMTVGDVMRRVATAWLLAVLVEYLLLPAGLRGLSGLEGLAQMSLLRILAITVVGAVALQILSCFWNTVTAERWAMVGIFVLLSALVVLARAGKAMAFLCIGITGILAVFAWKGREDSVPVVKEQPCHKAYGIVTAGLAVVFFLFVSVWTVGRVIAFASPGYDMGIFTQMFHNMSKIGLPMTTLERDMWMSHFHVHVSPIFYLMLPFYWLFPSAITLQVLQAAVMASAVLPAWLLCKRHGLSGLQRTLVCALLLVMPAFSGGVNYDIHENCFLTPLLLWLLYGIDSKKIPVIAVSAVLTLMVKEDAAVYVAVVALWLLVKALLTKEKGKDLVVAVSLLVGSIGWFFCATGYLNAVGKGVMSNRYDNFMYDGSNSLFTVIKAVIMNPMKAIYECVDPEKWKYIGQTMLPLLCLPLLTRRYERYILLIPYVLVNLMSDYRYQHDVLFQYSFGSIACLIYLTVVNLADIKISWCKVAALVAAIAISLSWFVGINWEHAKYNAKRAVWGWENYVEITQIFSELPEDASVTATTFYTVPLANRQELYELYYASHDHVLGSDYVVLNPDSEYDYRNFVNEEHPDGFAHCVEILEENGFVLYKEVPGKLCIYKNTNS